MGCTTKQRDSIDRKQKREMENYNGHENDIQIQIQIPRQIQKKYKNYSTLQQSSETVSTGSKSEKWKNYNQHSCLFIKECLTKMETENIFLAKYLSNIFLMLMRVQ